MMTHRERTMAALSYRPYDRLPLIHFGFWKETLQKWHGEGHLTAEEAAGWEDGNRFDRLISAKLGFDFNWMNSIFPWFDRYGIGLVPPFEQRLIEERPDGTRLLQNVDGVVVMKKAGAVSIPAEVDHLLKDRASWEAQYLPRLQYSRERVDERALERMRDEAKEEDLPLGIYCGSMIGRVREWCGLVGLSYIAADDEGLFYEMIDTYADLCFQVAEQVLATGIHFDFAHFWEDICFKGGPLVNPRMFDRKIGPHYARIVNLLHEHGISIVSLDCDGKIDRLLPTWLNAGVNTMCPIEVGTWGASIGPWREQYGTQIRGVGGLAKHVFAQDRDAVDAEIRRLKPLIELGGYVPCPDHRLPPDAEWENVRYYCVRMREQLG